MNYSSDAAEQIVRMSLNGVEVAAKISGKATERLIQLLIAASRGNQKTKGKMRLSNMLRGDKPLSVFAVKDNELQKFCTEAKRYGVLYCVLKDKKANDGLTDIMVRSMDASKVQRIFERFNLSAIDMGSIKTEIQKEKNLDNLQVDSAQIPTEDTKMPSLNDFLKTVVPDETVPVKEDTENPTIGRAAFSRSAPSLENSKETHGNRSIPDIEQQQSRPSVRQELKALQEANKPTDVPIASYKELQPAETVHQQPKSSFIKRLLSKRGERT